MSRGTRTLLVATALSALALSACADPAGNAGGDGSGQTAIGGSGPEDPTSNASEQPSATTPSPSGTPLPAQLSVTVDEGNGIVRTYALSCQPVGGDHPDPAAACAGLAAAGTEVFTPPNPDLACTEIYGGPQTAAVTGRVGSVQVSSTFSRANGCEIARWDALASLFASTGGAY